MREVPFADPDVDDELPAFLRGTGLEPVPAKTPPVSLPPGNGNVPRAGAAVRPRASTAREATTARRLRMAL